MQIRNTSCTSTVRQCRDKLTSWYRRGVLQGGCWSLLLAHVNLLLAVYAGASLATAARLKSDPSTYIAVRVLFPTEYRVCAAATAAGGALQLLLAHVAIAALHASRRHPTRILLLIYAGAMLALALAEVVLCTWLVKRLLDWLMTDTALFLLQIKAVHRYLWPILRTISAIHRLPQDVYVVIDKLVAEAEEDAPRNLYVLGVAGLLLALLQPLAIVLALIIACYRRSSELKPVLRVESSQSVVVESGARSVYDRDQLLHIDSKRTRNGTRLAPRPPSPRQLRR